MADRRDWQSRSQVRSVHMRWIITWRMESGGVRRRSKEGEGGYGLWVGGSLSNGKMACKMRSF